MSLSRLARAIDIAGTQARARNEPDGGFTPFDTLQAIVVEQIATAGDALDDWRDIVPEDVEEVERRLRKEEPSIRSGDK